MPSHIEPSPNTRPRSYPWSATVEYGGGVRGWVVPSTDHRASRAEYLGFVADEIGTFSADYSSASFTVTVEGGEAYAAGKYLCTTESEDIVLDGNANITVGVGYAADSSDDVQIRTADDFPADGAWLPIWQFDTDADGVDIAYDRRPLAPDEAPGTVTYGRAEAEQKFIAESTADDRYLNKVDGDTVEGGVTINGDLAVDETLAVGAGASVAGQVATEHRVRIASGATNPIQFVDPDGGVVSLAGLLDSDEVAADRAIGFSNTDDGTDPEVWFDMQTGRVNASGLNLGDDVAVTNTDSYATLENDSSSFGSGWRFYDPNSDTEHFAVDNEGEGTLSGPLVLGGGLGDVSSTDEDDVAMRRRDVAAEFVGSADTREIVVGSSEPDTWDYQDGDLWVDPS